MCISNQAQTAINVFADAACGVVCVAVRVAVCVALCVAVHTQTHAQKPTALNVFADAAKAHIATPCSLLYRITTNKHKVQ